MAAIKKILRDGTNQILPITRVDCVVVGENQLLNQVLKDMQDKINGDKDSALTEYMAATDAKIEALEGKVGDANGGLVKDVADLQNVKAADRLAALETFKDTTQPAIDQAQDDRLDALEGKVGDAESGLVKDVVDLKVADVTINGKIGTLETFMNNHSDVVRDAKITALEGKVGDDKGGLLKDVADLKTKDQNLEGRVAANEAFVTAQPGIDAAQDAKIKALEDANKEGGAVKQAIDAAQEAAEGAQEAAQGAQADVDAVVERLDDEGGLVDRLEAVEAFKGAHSHETIEQGIADNKAAIDVLKGGAEVTGSVAKAVADAVKVEKDRAELAEQGLGSRIAAFEDKGALDVAALKVKVEANAEFVAAQPAKDKVQNDRLSALEKLVVGGEGEGIEAVIADVAKNTGDIAKLNGDANTEGSVAKAVATALTTAQGEVQAESKNREQADKALDERIKKFEAGGANSVAALAGRVSTNENDIAKLNGDANTEGSVAKAVADGIAGVVASAPEDFDTLKEIADWIANDKTGAAGLQSGVAANTAAIEKLNGDANTAGSVAKAVADAVKAEETRATLAEQGLAERIAAFEGEEGSLAKLAARVVKNEEFVAAHSHTTIEKGIADNKAAIEAINKADTGILAQAKAYADGKDAAITAAQNAADKAQGEVDALEVVVGDDSKGLMGRVKVLEDVNADSRLDTIEAFMGAQAIIAEDFDGNYSDILDGLN